MDFDSFFREATGVEPYPWQARIAEEGLPDVLSIPTGLGKTEGIALGWAYRRLVTSIPGTPRHLVYVLPQRALVQQTVLRLRKAFNSLSTGAPSLPFIEVHRLMGGTSRDEQKKWYANPEKEWILVGTQDQLLSRALNRGYAMSPYEWPVHFGILNDDCHWVLDEVQLMGPAVWTSAQLDWMRKHRFGTIFPTSTTWMSATVGTNFLHTRDRKDEGMREAPPFEIDPRTDGQHPSAKVRLDARRPVEIFDIASLKETKPAKGRAKAESKKSAAGKNKDGASPDLIAQAVLQAHEPGTLSLVVCNTVKSAQDIYQALPDSAPRLLLTSRFRADDREKNENALRSFEEKRKDNGGKLVPNDPGLICVATQVVEAGIDVSSRRLWSEVAPWASVIQRLGRLNRDGRDNEAAHAVFFEPLVDKSADKSKERIGPYPREAVEDARVLLEELAPLSHRMSAREALLAVQKGKHEDLVMRSLKAKEVPLPRAVDVHGLFSNERDVVGGFTDVSLFVRDSDDNQDVHVFWRDFKPRLRDIPLVGEPFDPKEACRVSLHDLTAADREMFVWDPEVDRWQRLSSTGVRPGMVVMLPASAGGYRPDLGWTGLAEHRVTDLGPPGPGLGSLNSEHRSNIPQGWVKLKTHLKDAEEQAVKLLREVGLSEQALSEAVRQAAAAHDIGKAHPKWQGALPPAKPGQIWAKFQAKNIAFRPNMRHEAASALAMMSRHLRGEQGLSFLAIYLAAAHHGKVRTHLRAYEIDGRDVCGVPRSSEPLPLDGGLSMDFRCAEDGAAGEFTAEGFVLEAPGWTGLISDLLGPPRPDRPWDTGSVPAHEPRNLGPFRLAYLEALVRIADWRASDEPSKVEP